MTPQEKAKELFWKYRPIIAGKQFVTGLVLMSEAKELTKQCVLIAVAEMILVLPFTDTNASLNEYAIHLQKYLEQVKQEIELL
jgi:hypothetical protein